MAIVRFAVPSIASSYQYYFEKMKSWRGFGKQKAGAKKPGKKAEAEAPAKAGAAKAKGAT